MTSSTGRPDPLAPGLTLAGLDKVLHRCVRPVPSDRTWVEVVPDRLPPAWRPVVQTDVTRLGRIAPGGRVVLPWAEWQARARTLRTQAEAVLRLRDALRLADRGPSPDDLARAPQLEPWRVIELGRIGPCLEGRRREPSPLRPEGMVPTLLIGLGPAGEWARTLHVWYRLGRPEGPGAVEPEPGTQGAPRPLGRDEIATALRVLRTRIERMVRDLVVPERDGEGP